MFTPGTPRSPGHHRHSRCERGAAGGQDRAESTPGGLVKRKHAHRIELPRGTAPLS